MKNEEIKSMLDELISILLVSCTQVHDDGVVQHSHDLFDNTDINRLQELRIKIALSSGKNK